MKDWEHDAHSRPLRASSGRQALVVRQVNQAHPLEDVLERLEHLEASSDVPVTKESDGGPASAAKFELKTIVAVAAILLSITGYVIEDARNTSRQDAEIETTTARVTSLEKIASANTEARIRTEVQLGQLREGQQEIKDMLRAHDDQTLKIFQRK